MASSRLKTSLQYIVIFGVTVFLIWFSLRGLQPKEGEDKWGYILDTWNSADKGWLFFMAVVAIISHVIRAERWKMLLAPTGNNVTLTNSFLSLMIGYLVNLVIPRGGEVSRCYNLYRLDKAPVEISFGTVVLERIVDVICLLVLLSLSFVFESVKILSFVETLPISFSPGGSKINIILILLLSLMIAGVATYFFIIRNERLKKFMKKILGGFKDGLMSVFKLPNKSLFITYSLIIWSLYFLMSYTVIMAFPETSALGFSAVLTLFAIGSIAMAAPLPGGTGSYHTLVPAGLVFLYQVPQSEAVAFTFVFHGWQTLIMIVGGALSVLATAIKLRRPSSAV
ncbi:MAG: flippase-like domain-containing protein [Flammeovirgaceae bacterium]|nr:flippase-like domain-containing protein [Flammeovirgaceae bacterium]